MTLPIVVVYGRDHAAHIRNVLIPALAAQQGAPGLSLHVLHYADNIPLLAGVRHDGLVVHDWSAERENTHLGFGEGVNVLFSKLPDTPYFLTLNPDTIPDNRCMAELVAAFEPGKTGIVEARQWPSEHPKAYDRKTGVTDWASGACALIDSAFFRKVGGFDPLYFLYCEDVDLSWRAWLEGLQVRIAPRATVAHYTGLLHYRADRYYYEHYYSARNFLVIARKFFGETGERRAIKLLRATGYPKPFIQQVLDDYQSIRPRIVEIKGADRHPHIQILGFNCYHEMQRTAA